MNVLWLVIGLILYSIGLIVGTIYVWTGMLFLYNLEVKPGHVEEMFKLNREKYGSNK